jgi:stage IV sporulation protein A
LKTRYPLRKQPNWALRKVIADHSTIGLLVTTDGSITEIPRQNYITGGEERVVKELKAINKPFVMLLNSTRPRAEETKT